MNMHTVNKKTVTRRPVKYAALSSGTVSSVWYDEDQAATMAGKRRNHITLQCEKTSKLVTPHYDA